MKDSNKFDGFLEDWRGSPDETRLTDAAALAKVRRGVPSAMARHGAVDSMAGAIAEDSAKLRLAGRLISWATAGNAVRFERVAAARQAIEAGKYGVSSGDLARKLMDGMRG